MANSDKNILITPSTDTSNEASIVFTGAGNDPITLRVLDTAENALSIEGSAGQLFAITNNLTGDIFEVNDASGIPIVRATDASDIYLNEFLGLCYVGQTADDWSNIAPRTSIVVTGGISFTPHQDDDTPSETAMPIIMHETNGTPNDLLIGTRSGTAQIAFYTGNAGTDGNLGASSNGKRMSINASGDVNVVGAFSKGSGSFKIDHPLEEKKDSHYLVHSFVESPFADLTYSGMVTLVDGTATVNIDEHFGMSEGTFEVLCGNVRRFCSNESGFTQIRSSITGNILTIEAQDATCTDEVFFMVIGERKDEHMIDTNWTDENGRVIVEPEKNIA